MRPCAPARVGLPRALTDVRQAKVTAKAAKQPAKKTSDYPAAVARAFCSLNAALASDLGRAWPMGVPENEFMSVVVRAATRALENPNAAKGDPRTALVGAIATLVHRFPAMVPSVSTALLGVVTAFEHAAPVAADCAAVAAKKGDRKLGSEMLR